MTSKERAVRGYCGIGVEHGKNAVNLGTLWRSADLFEADFIFTVGRRYTRQASDTLKSYRHIPLFNFETMDDLVKHLPFDCRLVGIELAPSAVPLASFEHPERCVYVLGAEDHGMSKVSMGLCHKLVQLPGRASMNVAACGTVVLYDRHVKTARTRQPPEHVDA